MKNCFAVVYTMVALTLSLVLFYLSVNLYSEGPQKGPPPKLIASSKYLPINISQNASSHNEFEGIIGNVTFSILMDFWLHAIIVFCTKSLFKTIQDLWMDGTYGVS